MAKIGSELTIPRVKLTNTIVDMSDQPPGKVVSSARGAFNEGITRTIKFRKNQLRKLLSFLDENRAAIIEALYHDLRKPQHEAICYEIDVLANETRCALYNLDKWAKPTQPSKALINFLDGVYVYQEPFGVVLVIGSWNYPLQLTMCPVVG